MKQRGFAPVLIVLAIAILVVAGYFGYKYFKSNFQIIPVSTPTPLFTPKTTPDSTANWKTYTNTVENFTFKYPVTWTIDTTEENGDAQKKNISIKLASGSALIRFNVDMYGIGGVGQDFQGTPFNFLGNSFYKYKITGADGKTVIVGITDELKASLGLFRINGKTYGFSLSYPVGIDGLSYERDFDQILSTFEFTK